jgi:hypothetical protein
MRKQRLVCVLLLTPGLGLAAADKSGTGEKLHLGYNIPLWPDGKVPGAVGAWAVDEPYLTVVLPPEGKGTRRHRMPTVPGSRAQAVT